jgi:hypothetical protein
MITIPVLEKEDFRCAGDVFGQFWNSINCVCRWGVIGVGGANGLWEMGQLNHSMGLEWREVRILAPKATNKGFFHLKAHTLIADII